MLATGTAGVVAADDTSGGLRGASPNGAFGPETIDVTAISSPSARNRMVIDRTNATAYLSELTGACPPISHEVVAGGVKSASLVHSGAADELLFGTPAGIAAAAGNSSPPPFATVQPTVTPVERGSRSCTFFSMCDGSLDLLEVSNPGLLTNVDPGARDRSATISSSLPRTMDGFSVRTSDVSVVGDAATKCTTKNIRCTISALTTGTSSHFDVAEVMLGPRGRVRSNAVTSSAPVLTTSTPDWTTTPLGRRAATGASSARLDSLGVLALLRGGLLLSGRRISQA